MPSTPVPDRPSLDSRTPLTGLLALITGASRGIGAACAETLAATGARLAICSRSEGRLSELADSLRRRHGADVHPFTCDVSDSADVERALSDLPTDFSEFDILVNNAGMARSLVPLHDQPAAEFDEMIDTNVKGLLYVTRFVVSGMVRRGRGHVVNIGSTAGHSTYPGGTVYCATKHAVGAITRGLKMDLHGTPIRVSTVDPGMVETDFSLVRFRGDRERADAIYADTRPLAASDVADAVLWCLTRPDRVNIAEVIMTSVDQSAATMIHRTRTSS